LNGEIKCPESVRLLEKDRLPETMFLMPTTKRDVDFCPNIHDHRFWLASEKRFVKLRVSAKGMRIIDKLGLEKVVADLKARGERV